MKPVLTRAEMRAYDQRAITTGQVPGLILMENAGRGAAEVIAQLVPAAGAHVSVVCGAGNNGGDGFVVARHLLARGYDVECLAAGAEEKLTSDARVHRDAYVGLRGRYRALTQAADVNAALASATVVVDALLGIGLDRAVEGTLKGIIAAMNGASALRVALDIPSGLDADSGAVLGAAVEAHHTITFGCLKMGLLSPGGLRHAGKLHVVGLGLPPWVVDDAPEGGVARLIDGEAVSGWLSPRSANAYKHAVGNVLVLAGSVGKLGAALLVSHAALRGGAGLVTVATWPGAFAALQSRVLEVMTAALALGDLAGSADRALAGKSVAIIGPGLGLDACAGALVDHVVLRWPGRKVVDADALTHFAGRPEALADAAGEIVITPHAGEAAALLGVSAREVESDRARAARSLAERARATVVLKGPRTIVASSEGLWVNASGTPALATAGSGDVLAGLLGALACAMPLDQAAASAVHLHGLAGEHWAAERGGADRGLLASEIADAIPTVLAALARSPGGPTV